MQSISANDLESGKKFLVTVGGNVWQISQAGIKVPLASKNSESKLTLNTCELGSPLQLNYQYDQERVRIVSTGSAVNQIRQLD